MSSVAGFAKGNFLIDNALTILRVLQTGNLQILRVFQKIFTQNLRVFKKTLRKKPAG